MHRKTKAARMVESVDTRDLKSLGYCSCVGSSPTPGTKYNSTALLQGSVSFSFAHSDNSHNSKKSHQRGIANLLYSYSNMKADTLSMCKAKYYNVCLRAESYKNEGHKRYGCRTQSIGLQAENHRDAGRIPMR